MGPGWAAALWGFVVSDDLDGGRNTARKRPGCVDTRGGRLQWPSRQALGGHQRALGALITVIGSREISAGVEPAHRNGKVAMLTVGLSHDVSTMLGIGHHLGSQPRAKASITIMRAPQRGHGQGSTCRASGVISGCFCGSAGGTIWIARGSRRGGWFLCLCDRPHHPDEGDLLAHSRQIDAGRQRQRSSLIGPLSFERPGGMR